MLVFYQILIFVLVVWIKVAVVEYAYVNGMYFLFGEYCLIYFLKVTAIAFF